MRRFSALLSLLLLAAASLSAQTPAHITFTFEHPQLQPSRYIIAIDETGAGRFTSQPGSAPPATDSYDQVRPTPVDRSILLDDSLRADLFRYARSHNFFATRCSTTQPGLAFTGNKTLSYSGPDGNGTCTFVWAGDPALHRLGLDAELAALQEAVKEHRADDLANIADDLHAVAENQQVMDRARKRAQALLASSQMAAKNN
jgi:hypothetical protein